MEIGLAVGGAFLSSGLQVIFDRLAPQGELLKMFQRNKHDLGLLEKLEDILLGLQVVLRDAENKQASNSYVSRWFDKLQSAVDGAENLIEEINYEALRLKVEGQHQNVAETSNHKVSDLNLCLSDEIFLDIKEHLEDTIKKLEELQNQIARLDLPKYLDSDKQETRKSSTSVVVESEILGRQNEKEELVHRLLHPDANSTNLTVIPIVGMAGIGKTTLAKAGYNDDKVEKYFDLKAWVCVSEPYEAHRIIREILQEFGFKVDGNLNQLQKKLKECLKGKKFLIVLDDVWNENYNHWDDLRSLFVQGKGGSTIIVTTRKESVALMMGTKQISMDTLSSEVSWSLFERHAFENKDPKEHLELQEVGKKIAAKCKGLPLALKTLAGMLRSKSEVEGWKHILRSEIWELPDDNDILPALMLSYNDLPPHLKRCFSYCAIFPKDYPFRKEKVIQLWIANGVVQLRGKDETREDLGNQYFFELRSRSLFERVRESSKWKAEEFLMHDLINDLARIASSKLCINLEDLEGSHMLEKSRHLSYSMGYGDFEKLKPLYKLEQLRTLIPISFDLNSSIGLSKRVLHNILPSLKSLRALSLSRYRIKELPNDLFIKLKLLRFLDLSWTEIKKLPDSICVLYNLETLLLSGCRYLEELPLQMETLINLHHLDISKTSSLLKMPLHLSKLKNLHVLLGAKFLLSDCSSLRIGDLGELHNLYGSLSILELQNVIGKREARKANMREKENVDMLSLEWSESNIAVNFQNERDILDELQPNSNIEELQITGYRGKRFPTWLVDHTFLKLVGLSLSNCKDCDSLPALGQLPSLKFLTIRRMHGIIEVTEEFYGSLSSKPFNSLKKLEFADMLEWKQWHVLGNGEFSTLEDLSIKDCPKLIGKLPESLSSLTILTISKCPELILGTPIQLPSLKKLEVFASPKVGVVSDHDELFASLLQGMKQIDELSIVDCNSLTSLPVSILPSTLKRLRILSCGISKYGDSVSEIITRQRNVFLESLRLDRCDSIDDIPPKLVALDIRLAGYYRFLLPGIGTETLKVRSCDPRACDLRVAGLDRFLIPDGTEELDIWSCEDLEILSAVSGTQMKSLRSLSIGSCKKLKSLPENVHKLLPSLNELELSRCPEIESFPEGGLPFNLEILRVCDCEKLVNGRKEWHLERLLNLRSLVIAHDGSDEEILAGDNWELPCSIRRLTVSNLKTLSSPVLKSLTSLVYLRADYLPQIQSLLEARLPSSLSELEIMGHHEFHLTKGLQHLTSLERLQFWHFCPSFQSVMLPSSLSVLTIWDCPNLQSLSESTLPSSLSVLTIRDCANLQSLSELALPSSLSKLNIWKCPNLQSLPVKGMPSSISCLSIYRCPLVKPLLEFDKGEYWPEIAHISELYLEEECLF